MKIEITDACIFIETHFNAKLTLDEQLKKLQIEEKDLT